MTEAVSAVGAVPHHPIRGPRAGQAGFQIPAPLYPLDPLGMGKGRGGEKGEALGVPE